MSVVRKLLYWYRKFQYTLFARSEEGLTAQDERNRASNILFRGIIKITEVNKLFS